MSAPPFPFRTKPRLLIVEDEPDLRVLVHFAAKRSEVFSIICTAEDGQAAFDMVQAGVRGERADMPPDVIFSDWNMPRMTGLELTRALKRAPETKRIAVALFTSSQSAFEREQARAAGCCAHFAKPTDLLELTAIMRSLPVLCHEAALREQVLARRDLAMPAA